MSNLILILETDHLSIYSPKHTGESLSEFEKFLEINSQLSEKQLKLTFDAIVAAIDKMREVGARENLFRPEGGNIKAIPLFVKLPRKADRTIGTLRLYCIRISDRILVIGNGGIKKVDSYQQDTMLSACVDELREIDRMIRRALRRQGVDPENFEAVKKILETITFAEIV